MPPKKKKVNYLEIAGGAMDEQQGSNNSAASFGSISFSTPDIPVSMPATAAAVKSHSKGKPSEERPPTSNTKAPGSTVTTTKTKVPSPPPPMDTNQSAPTSKAVTSTRRSPQPADPEAKGNVVVSDKQRLSVPKEPVSRSPSPNRAAKKDMKTCVGEGDQQHYLAVPTETPATRKPSPKRAERKAKATSSSVLKDSLAQPKVTRSRSPTASSASERKVTNVLLMDSLTLTVPADGRTSKASLQPDSKVPSSASQKSPRSAPPRKRSPLPVKPNLECVIESSEESLHIDEVVAKSVSAASDPDTVLDGVALGGVSPMSVDHEPQDEPLMSKPNVPDVPHAEESEAAESPTAEKKLSPKTKKCGVVKADINPNPVPYASQQKDKSKKKKKKYRQTTLKMKIERVKVDDQLIENENGVDTGSVQKEIYSEEIEVVGEGVPKPVPPRMCWSDDLECEDKEEWERDRERVLCGVKQSHRPAMDSLGALFLANSLTTVRYTRIAQSASPKQDFRLAGDEPDPPDGAAAHAARHSPPVTIDAEPADGVNEQMDVSPNETEPTQDNQEPPIETNPEQTEPMTEAEECGAQNEVAEGTSQEDEPVERSGGVSPEEDQDTEPVSATGEEGLDELSLAASQASPPLSVSQSQTSAKKRRRMRRTSFGRRRVPKKERNWVETPPSAMSASVLQFDFGKTPPPKKSNLSVVQRAARSIQRKYGKLANPHKVAFNDETQVLSISPLPDRRSGEKRLPDTNGGITVQLLMDSDGNKLDPPVPMPGRATKAGTASSGVDSDSTQDDSESIAVIDLEESEQAVAGVNSCRRSARRKSIVVYNEQTAPDTTPIKPTNTNTNKRSQRRKSGLHCVPAAAARVKEEPAVVTIDIDVDMEPEPVVAVVAAPATPTNVFALFNKTVKLSSPSTTGRNESASGVKRGAYGLRPRRSHTPLPPPPPAPTPNKRGRKSIGPAADKAKMKGSALKQQAPSKPVKRPSLSVESYAQTSTIKHYPFVPHDLFVSYAQCAHVQEGQGTVGTAHTNTDIDWASAPSSSYSSQPTSDWTVLRAQPPQHTPSAPATPEYISLRQAEQYLDSEQEQTQTQPISASQRRSLRQEANAQQCSVWTEQSAVVNAALLADSHNKQVLFIKHWLQLWQRAHTDDTIVTTKVQRMRESRHRGGSRGSSASDSEYSTDEESDADALRSLMLLSGPPGCGKTALVHALCDSLNVNVIELSSNVLRSSTKAKERLQGALHSHRIQHKAVNTFFTTNTAKHKDTPAPEQTETVAARANLILLDEVDITFPEYDESFWSMIKSLVDESRVPIILTCNEWRECVKQLDGQQLYNLYEHVHMQVNKEHMATVLQLFTLYLGGCLMSRAQVSECVRAFDYDIRAALLHVQCWLAGSHTMDTDTDTRMVVDGTKLLHCARVDSGKMCDGAMSLCYSVEENRARCTRDTIHALRHKDALPSVFSVRTLAACTSHKLAAHKALHSPVAPSAMHLSMQSMYDELKLNAPSVRMFSAEYVPLLRGLVLADQLCMQEQSRAQQKGQQTTPSTTNRRRSARYNAVPEIKSYVLHDYDPALVQTLVLSTAL